MSKRKKQAKKLQKKKTTPPKQNKGQELSPEIRALRSRLQGQIKNAPNEYRAKKLRNQLKIYDLLIAEQLKTPTPKKKSTAGQKKGRKQSPKPPAPASSLKPAYGILNEIWAKYPNLDIKSTKTRIKALDAEIRDLRTPIYNLRRQIKNAPSRYKAQKLKTQLQTYELIIADQLNGLMEQRADFRKVEEQKNILRKAKKSLQGKIKSIDKKIYDADEEQDYEEMETQTYQKIKTEGNIANIDRYLGIVKETPAPTYVASTEPDEAGYLEDPANPYTIWDAIRQLDTDLTSAQWLYFVINGKRFAADNVIQIRVEATSFWRILKRPESSTPRVDRLFNLDSLTVKYIDHKG